LNVYYSKSTGNPRSVDSYENDSVVVNSYINLSSIRTYGFDVTIPYYPAAMPFKLWDWIDMMFVKYSWYNVRQEGQYLKENLTTDKSVWSLTANGVFTIWDDLKLMAYLRYTPKQSDQRVTTYASTDLTLSLNKNFYDSKLRLSLIIQNALNTSRYQGETRGSNYFNAYSTLQLHPRSIMLTLTYIFNNYKEKTERKVDDGRDKSNEGLF
jgi:hypothetical protein